MADSAISVPTHIEGANGRLAPRGDFDLAHVSSIEEELRAVEYDLEGCSEIELHLGDLDRIGAGAALLARVVDRLDQSSETLRIVESSNPEAARLIALYRERRGPAPTSTESSRNPLTRLGASAATLPSVARNVLNAMGGFAAAIQRAAVAPSSVNLRSVPDLRSSRLERMRFQ